MSPISQAAFDKSSSCHYCGDPIETSTKTVPSCGECQGVLSDKSSACCLAGKAEFIHSRYITKYEEPLNLVDWCDEELEAMGQGMRGYIRKSLADKYTVEARLAHLAFKGKNHSCDKAKNPPVLQITSEISP